MNTREPTNPTLSEWAVVLRARNTTSPTDRRRLTAHCAAILLRRCGVPEPEVMELVVSYFNDWANS